MPTAGFEHFCLMAAFVASVVFILGYTVLAPWWRHDVGRAVVSLDVGLLLALLPGTLHYWTGLNVANAFFAWYYCLSLLLIAGITLWRLKVVYHLQREGLREIEDQQTEESM